MPAFQRQFIENTRLPPKHTDLLELRYEHNLAAKLRRLLEYKRDEFRMNSYPLAHLRNVREWGFVFLRAGIDVEKIVIHPDLLHAPREPQTVDGNSTENQSDYQHNKLIRRSP